MHFQSLTSRTAALVAAVSILALPALVGAQTVEVSPDKKVEKRVVFVRNHGDDPHAMAYSMAHRGYLGISLLNLTPELRDHFGVGADEGVMVSSVQADSPAGAAGLTAGDIVVAVDGESVQSSMEIVHTVGSHSAGDVVEVEVVRDGQLRSLSATLAERERPEMDIGRWAWSSDDDEHQEFIFNCEDEENCPPLLEIDPELMEGAMSNLRMHLDSPHVQRRMIEFHEGNEDLVKRLEELEQQLTELQSQLEKLEK